MLESGNPAIFASGVSVDPAPPTESPPTMTLACELHACSGQYLEVLEKAKSHRGEGTRWRARKCQWQRSAGFSPLGPLPCSLCPFTTGIGPPPTSLDLFPLSEDTVPVAVSTFK